MHFCVDLPGGVHLCTTITRYSQQQTMMGIANEVNGQHHATRRGGMEEMKSDRLIYQ